MPKILFARYIGLSPAISSQFSVELSAASKNCEKFTKLPFWGVQGRSRSPMFTNQKSLSPVLVTISSTSVPICNRFHTIRANNGKRTSFGGYPSLTPSFVRNPLTQWHEILSRKTRDLVILACTFLIQITSVADRRTDGQTDRRLDDG